MNSGPWICDTCYETWPLNFGPAFVQLSGCPACNDAFRRLGPAAETP